MNTSLICALVHLLFEQDGAESGVEGTKALGSRDFAEATEEATRECRLRHQTDSGSLQRAEGDISEELGGG